MTRTAIAAIRPPASWATQYGTTSEVGNCPPAASPADTAGLKWPPERCPNAKIISPRPKPKPTAMPRFWMAPGPCVHSAAMPVKPMKKKPKVPMTSAASRFVMSVCMRFLPRR